MLRPSFVPPWPIRRLRDLTRYRIDLVGARTAEKNRVEKLLEDACIKLSVVASDIFGVSGRAMMAALIAGERNPKVLAQMAKSRMRTKIDRLEEAFNGHFDNHHRFLLAKMLDRIDGIDADIAALDAEIEAHLVPFAAAAARLDEIPGIGPVAAAIIIAELGVDMSRFPTPGHLCSWAKFSPGISTSAGRPKGNGSTGHGNRYLARILGEAAVVAGHTKTFLGERYRRIARRRGKKRAIVAIGRCVLVIIWHLLHNPDTRFHDLGADHFSRHINPNTKKRNHIRQLEALGYIVRTPSAGGRKRSRSQEIRTFATTTNSLLVLRDWLVSEKVTLVVMEATGDYWRGAFYLLEDSLNVVLANATHVKGLPGRKTDVSDSAWLCQLGECGLVRPSFVPPEPIRHLRDLTRYRITLMQERTREAQRLEKEFEDAGIKLSSVASDILGRSGRQMLAALIDGEQDVNVIADMAKASMRKKIPQLVEALTGDFGEHHAFLCRLHLERIDQITTAIEELSERIEDQMRPFSRQLDRLETIPGVGRRVAEVIIAETGGDMDRFRTDGHLTSWAGVCPGHHESAGKRKSGKTRSDNKWLAGALGIAAMSAIRTRDTYLGARYNRLLPRLGKQRALVALQRSILTSIWHMLSADVDYHDLGADYFANINPDRAMRRIVRQANALGYTVRFDPLPAA